MIDSVWKILSGIFNINLLINNVFLLGVKNKMEMNLIVRRSEVSMIL